MRIFALHSFLCWNTDGYQQKLKTMFIFHIPQKVFTYKQDYYSVRIRLFEIRPWCTLCAFPCHHIWCLHIPQCLVTAQRPCIFRNTTQWPLQWLNNIIKYNLFLLNYNLILWKITLLIRETANFLLFITIVELSYRTKLMLNIASFILKNICFLKIQISGTRK